MNVSDIYQYADDVLSGKIVAGQLVRQACERFQADLAREDIYFDEQAANLSIQWFNFLHHVKGELAPDHTIHLEPWQCFITGNMFGWKYVDTDLRRFRTAYIEIARKNGKTSLAAGWGGFLFVVDDEYGAEIYSSATTRDQAKIVFSIFKEMVNNSDPLKKRIKCFKNNMSIEERFSKFEPLSSDFNTLDGLNTHGSICDEVHRWPMRDLWDVIEESTAARVQPLQIAITTAGSDRNTICYELREYSERILNGYSSGFNDDSFFPMIYTVDKGDNWEDDLHITDPAESKVLIKANPNLGISVKVDYLIKKMRKVQGIPAAQNSFLRKHLNVWTQQVTRWIDLDLWDANFTNEVYVKEV
jgi:phage terminase large subunit-like protein